jgi:hypothetical protein
MEQKHKDWLIKKTSELAKGINLNHAEVLAELISGNVISFEFPRRVSLNKSVNFYSTF